jgi:hypothetical protein
MTLLVVLFAGCMDDSLNTNGNGVEGGCEVWETSETPAVLWPVDHQMRQFTLADCVSIIQVDCPMDDNGDGYDKRSTTPSLTTVLTITSITTNEADDGTGDGSTTDDAVIIDATTFSLRAERLGNGDSRLYTVNFVDDQGETGYCLFLAPHDTIAQ